jgi:hypothetical protein
MAATMTGVVIAGSVDELLAGATDRRPMKNADSLSGSRFERLLLDGEPHIVKYASVEDDWLMRASGDTGWRQGALWGSDIVRRLPAEIDPAVVGVAPHRGPRGTAGIALLMRDASAEMVPEGSSVVPDERHLRFLDHMAALHASLWDWRDEAGLNASATMYTFLTPVTTALEASRGGTDAVPRLIAPGWERFAEVSPRASATVLPLLADPGPLIAALAETPSTFIHGDWKLGNLGSHADGRTVLIDWDRCGRGPACADLAWYLAINCARMTVPKEEAIAAYRRSLEQRGVDTSGWWEAQLALSLLGGLLTLGWDKAAGDRAELSWWEDRAVEGAEYLR